MHSVLGRTFDTEPTAKLMVHLKEYREEMNQGDVLAKKTDDFAKTLWTAFKQTPALAGKEPKPAAHHFRLKLRVEISALFHLYQENSGKLKADTLEFQSMESMLRTVSEKALIAHQKGYISKKDLKEIVKELSIIHRDLEKAKEIEIPSLQQLKMIGMKPYTAGHLSTLDIHSPQENFPIAEEESEELISRDPTPKPKASTHPVITLSGAKHTIIKDMAGIKMEVADLVQSPSLDYAISSVNRMEFSPYIRNKEPALLGISPKNFDPNVNSEWWKISKKDAIALMMDMNQLSEWLTDELEKQETVSIYGYEALLKISSMVLFLNSRFFKQGPDSHFQSDITNKIKNLYHLSTYDLFGTYEYESKQRTGHRLNFLNYHTSQELRSFSYAIDIIEDQSLSKEQGQENFKYALLQNQLLKRLEKSKISPFFKPAQMQQWMRPLKHPFLLAAYRNVGIHVGEHAKSAGVGLQGIVFGLSQDQTKKIQDKHTKHLQHKEGMKTQEAIVDDPENVGAFLLDDLNAMIDYFNKQESSSEQDALLSPIKKEFSKEEMIAILLLLRRDQPQMELIAFMNKHSSLLNEPEIRNFIDMLFFHRSQRLWSIYLYFERNCLFSSIAKLQSLKLKLNITLVISNN